MKAENPTWVGVAKVAGVTGGAVALSSVAAWFGVAWYFARVLLTPEREKPDNTLILSVEDDTITLSLDAETRVRGHYGLWSDGGRTHVRVGDVLEVDESAGTVVRQLLRVDIGTPAPGPARWSSHIYVGNPAVSLGLPSRDVVVEGELGPLPAWIVDAQGAARSDRPGDPSANRSRLRGATEPVEPAISTGPAGSTGPTTPSSGGGGRWAVLVHGRGAMREECLRAVPVLHDLGITCLVPSYRNDSLAPASPDGLIALGLTEWRDVDACVQYCLDQSADDVLLVGWSMGGAIVLQTLARSEHRDRIPAVVLDGPVIDWVEVIEHQARLRRMPRTIVDVVRGLLGDRWTSRLLVGAEQPLDLATTQWQVRADELDRPILLIHSEDDDVVPVGASEALARARPDVVRFESWQDARHVKEWNVDPERWNAAVADFITELPPARGSHGPRYVADGSAPGRR